MGHLTHYLVVLMITNAITYDRPSLDVEYDYVGIIDGLSTVDRQDFRLSDELRTILNEAGIATALAQVGSRLEMLGALKAFHREALAGQRFMLHFVSHGNAKGVAAASELVEWEALRPFLEQIHSATGHSLILNMSTCKGLHGITMTTDTGPYPFFGLIGANEDLRVADALDANKRMYTKWIAGLPISVLVPETNREMGQELLFNISAEGFRKLSV